MTGAAVCSSRFSVLRFSQLLLCATLLLFSSSFVDGYKPILLVHGVLDHAADLNDLVALIKQAHPGTNVTSLDAYSGWFSLVGLWNQVKGFTDDIKPILSEAEDGFHLICYSQGGAVCRGLLSTLDTHKVDTFISLSGPLMGQYGDTAPIRKVLERFGLVNWTREHIYEFFYTTEGQEISVGNYWNDPFHQEEYRAKNNYLASLNNETEKGQSQEYKKNFLQIHKLVLIGGPDDGVITPWQSSQFGFYQSNSDKQVVEMKDQEVYLKDSFGLQTLYKRGDVHTCTVAGVTHTQWHSSQMVFDKCILPFLT